ncbi:MAG: hypothetical protein JWO13_281 [Acidobacteriales bacterium]|nr:hypothetical protein [Terriglobales bacterium]
MWTAVIAQCVVIVEDLRTMRSGDTLNATVSHTETTAACLLFIVMLYRTIACFKLMGETYSEWTTAFNQSQKDLEKLSAPSDSVPTIPAVTQDPPIPPKTMSVTG